MHSLFVELMTFMKTHMYIVTYTEVGTCVFFRAFAISAASEYTKWKLDWIIARNPKKGGIAISATEK